jgi:hypothetical protein
MPAYSCENMTSSISCASGMPLRRSVMNSFRMPVSQPYIM